MVKIAGEENGVDAIRSLNEPKPLSVRAAENGRPLAVLQGRKRMKVSSISDAWRVDDEWWRDQPVRRVYFQAILEDGQQLTLFQDELTGKWYAQRYS